MAGLPYFSSFFFGAANTKYSGLSRQTSLCECSYCLSGLYYLPALVVEAPKIWQTGSPLEIIIGSSPVSLRGGEAEVAGKLAVVAGEGDEALPRREVPQADVAVVGARGYDGQPLGVCG